MNIMALDVLKFLMSFIYLLILPGFNLLRTANRLDELEIEEKVMLSFGLSLLILIPISILLSLPESIGLNFYTLIISITCFILLTTKEVIDCAKRLLRLRH